MNNEPNVNPKTHPPGKVNVDCSESILNEIKSSKGLKITSLNVNSLLKHIDEIKVLLENDPFDIFAVNESKIDESISDNCINIPNYNVIRRDRNRRGGGVAIYIKSDLTVSERNDLVPNDLEMICIELKYTCTKPLILCAWYRPPNSVIETLNSYENFLVKLDSEDKEIILLGDLNCDYHYATNQESHSDNLKFLNSLYNLEQMIEEPTRITSSSSSLIDVILTNYPDRLVRCGVIHVGLSDHSLIYCIRKINFKLKSGVKETTYRSMKSFNLNKFKECLRTAPWE